MANKINWRMLEQGKEINEVLNKELKDQVRVLMTATYTGSGYTVAADDSSFDYAKAIPGGNKSEALLVYTRDNEPVFASDGSQLTYDFDSNSLSGNPHVIDEEKTTYTDAGVVENIAYKEVKANVEFKVFPTGKWLIKDLPSDMLLDNEEKMAVARAVEIKSVAMQALKNNALINELTAGTKVYHDKLTVKNELVDTSDESKGYKVQTVFPLAKVPTDEPVILIIQGVRYEENDAFTVDRTKKDGDNPAPELTWTFTEAAGGFDIDYGWVEKIEAEYHAVSSKA